MGFKSLKRSFSSHVPFLLRARILKILRNNGRVWFDSISEELGYPQDKIVEITKWTIARGKISGAITFDESGFISETELRHGVIRKDLTLNELLTEISKIAGPGIKYFDCRIATDGCLVLSLRIPRAHEIKSMRIEKNLFKTIAKVTQKKVDVKIMSRSVHVGENLLARGRKEYEEEIARALNFLLPLIGDLDLFNMIKMKAWNYVFPVERVLEALQSDKPVLMFLDENDSDFSSYLVEVLSTTQGFLSYYADYIHLKKRQKTFAQTLLSLLFLESKNIQTGKSFAEDVVGVLKEHPQTWIQETEHHREYNTDALILFMVFSAFLHGTEKQRAASIKFLKCMKCYPGHLKFDRWKLLVDVKDQKDTAKFFSDILTYFLLSGELGTNGRRRRFIACVGNIPILHMYCVSRYEQLMRARDLIDSGLPELFEQISSKLSKRKIKFCLVSKGNVHEILDTFVFGRTDKLPDWWTQRQTPSEMIQIVSVPLVLKAKMENLVLSIFKDLRGLKTLLGSLTSNLVSEEILKMFSHVLNEKKKGKVSVMDISRGLLALFGVAIQKYPRALALNDIYTLFDVVYRPVSEKARAPETLQAPKQPSRLIEEPGYVERLGKVEEERPSVELRLIDTSKLLISLVKCIHAEIEERIPFDLFCRLLVSYEYSKYELLSKYNHSLVVDSGGNPEFSIREKNKDKMLQRVSDLIYEKVDPQTIHEHDIATLLIRQTSDGQTKVTIHSLLSRIESGWKKILYSHWT